MTDLAAPVLRADEARFPPLAPDRAARWQSFGRWDRTLFPSLLGMVVEDVRTDYCRMRLPYRPELDQPGGVVHGGAVASLVDTVVVPAVGGAYDVAPRMLTVTMNVQFLGAVRGEDVVAEGWVERRGRSIVFCRAEVRTDPDDGDGDVVATGTLVYKVTLPREQAGEPG